MINIDDLLWGWLMSFAGHPETNLVSEAETAPAMLLLLILLL